MDLICFHFLSTTFLSPFSILSDALPGKPVPYLGMLSPRRLPSRRDHCSFPEDKARLRLTPQPWAGFPLPWVPCSHVADFTSVAEPLMKVEVKVAQSCPTLCDPTDYTVHGILQARILEWVAFPSSRGSSQPRDQTQASRIAGGFFTS